MIICQTGKSWSEILDKKQENEVYHFSIKPLAEPPMFEIYGARGVWAYVRNVEDASRYAARITNESKDPKKSRARVRIYLTPEQKEILHETNIYHRT